MPARHLPPRAAAILSRLLLVLGLLLGELIPDPRAAQAAAPTGAADLIGDTTPAILRAEAARLVASLPQDAGPEAVMAEAAALPAPRTIARITPPAPQGAGLPRAAHLRPFPHGPPAA